MWKYLRRLLNSCRLTRRAELAVLWRVLSLAHTLRESFQGVVRLNCLVSITGPVRLSFGSAACFRITTLRRFDRT
jgi:hypothetical protein